MGVICSKQNLNSISNPQKRVKFAAVTPMDDSNEESHHIGIEFQYQIQQDQPNFLIKKQKWEEYFQNRQDFINDEQYITLLRSPNQSKTPRITSLIINPGYCKGITGTIQAFQFRII
ncbi:unnamed protein product (macronuclear) [Paramecium tetraurelia]|uniref:Uncharacterized protein n=1 Tax=Paramecium tetraurelia TaxID=5888 RepID=A0CUC1_PARTE|nr:uncharacterized protein GSPATT00010588001 [Paramecium tetraurelia]CAK74388.1 unnamed protein product [Paramecium tetraurelia]|eukprot:XP_001441785.1 hypothetical protein (macronuclear) [Paramecium tetraurelia strain d4-2]